MDGEAVLAVAHDLRWARDECQRAAAGLGAEAFGVFTVMAGAERRLEPRMLSESGVAQAFLAALLGRWDSEVARHALASSAPFWWGSEACEPLSLGRLAWAARGSFEGLPQPGLGFPCASSRGACGVVLLWGDGVDATEDGCFALHARLFPVFELIAAARPRDGAALPVISRRELECLRLTAQGLTSEEIAEALKLSAHTANQHLAAAAAKLDAVNRMQAVAKALRLGLID
jgi:DNA-binding CsgD family transcriptional regulator